MPWGGAGVLVGSFRHEKAKKKVVKFFGNREN